VRFLVVANETEVCPYLPGRMMRLPLRMPMSKLGPADFDTQLALGDRRSGSLLYRPTCPSCEACEAIRVPVARFAPTRSQRRVLRRNEGVVRIRRVRPEVSDRHVALYNLHARERGLSLRSEATTEHDYRLFLTQTCVDTWELQYLLGDTLVAVSILDWGERAVSSVYHFFDPGEAWRSLGVFSVLKEIELCAALGVEWYYLGLYVRDCAHLNYKADYWPHQRRIGGIWKEFSRERR
jgi:arginine-tRNA-protein transferase